jgi:hypothetical protein
MPRNGIKLILNASYARQAELHLAVQTATRVGVKPPGLPRTRDDLLGLQVDHIAPT